MSGETHLETLFDKIEDSEHVELKIVIKADVQGTIEALNNSSVDSSR